LIGEVDNWSRDVNLRRTYGSKSGNTVVDKDEAKNNKRKDTDNETGIVVRTRSGTVNYSSHKAKTLKRINGTKLELRFLDDDFGRQISDEGFFDKIGESYFFNNCLGSSMFDNRGINEKG